MLRISLHESPASSRLQLEGRLEGAWVAEFERAFESARKDPLRKITVDLVDVSFIDEPGKQALAAAYRAGAELKATMPLTSAVVEEIRK